MITIVTTPANFYSGQTAKCVKEWKEITADPWILNSLQGIEIPFTDTPRQNSVPFPFRLSKSEKEAVDSEIVNFLDKRIFEQVVHQEGEWISNLFVRPKPDGSYRLILDLTELKGTMQTISPGRNRVNFQILAYLLTIDLLYGTGCLSY